MIELTAAQIGAIYFLSGILFSMGVTATVMAGFVLGNIVLAAFRRDLRTYNRRAQRPERGQ